jgi:hypothetical protein
MKELNIEMEGLIVLATNFMTEKWNVTRKSNY